MDDIDSPAPPPKMKKVTPLTGKRTHRALGSNASKAGQKATPQLSATGGRRKQKKFDIHPARLKGSQRSRSNKFKNDLSALPQNSPLVLSSRSSTRMRHSILFGEKHGLINLNKQREMNKNHAKVSAKDFARVKGVSMDFMNTFYQDLFQGEIFKDVKLFNHKQAKGTYCWNKEDPTKTEDGRAIVTHYNEKNRKTIYNVEMKIKIKDLVEKKRKHWTIADLINFCIVPELIFASEKGKKNSKKDEKEEEVEGKVKPELMAQPLAVEETLTYLDLLDDTVLGNNHQGYYILVDHSTIFSELMLALQEKQKDVDVAPMDTFIYLQMFAFDHLKIRKADTMSSKAMSSAYKEFLRHGVHDIAGSFENRFVFFDSHIRPRLLKRMSCIWELYGMKDTSYRVIMNGDDYDKMIDLVVAKNDGHIFTAIDLLDPSMLKTNSRNLQKVFTDAVAAEPQGLKTIKETIATGLTKWFTVDIESYLELLDANNGDNFVKIKEGSYTKTSQELLRAGIFNCKRNLNVLAKTYLDDALGFYAYFQVEEFLEACSDMSATDRNFTRPRHMTRPFVHMILQGLIKVRLYLARVLAKQSRYVDALQMMDDAENAANLIETSHQEKSDYKLECQLARAEIYAGEGEKQEAIGCYREVEISWKIYPEKKERLAYIRLELGRLLREQKSPKAYKEANTVLTQAIDEYDKVLQQKKKKGDVLKADLLTELGRLCGARNKTEEARKHFEEAQKLVFTYVGKLNERAAKLEYFIGNCFTALQMTDQALLNFDEAIKIMKFSLGANCSEVGSIFKVKGNSYRSLVANAAGDEADKLSELEEMSYRNALINMQKIRNPQSYKKKYLDIASYSVNLADTLSRRNKHKEASALYDEALKIRERELGSDAPATKFARQKFFTHKLELDYS